MGKENSSDILKRIIKVTAFLMGGIICLIYLFTKQVIYSIIFFLATMLSVLGFLLMIKVVDRILQNKKGQALFFLAALLKMGVIAAIFYAVSRISETAVLFYILGLSMIVFSIMVEGIYQLYRSFSNGRA